MGKGRVLLGVLSPLHLSLTLFSVCCRFHGAVLLSTLIFCATSPFLIMKFFDPDSTDRRPRVRQTMDRMSFALYLFDVYTCRLVTLPNPHSSSRIILTGSKGVTLNLLKRSLSSNCLALPLKLLPVKKNGNLLAEAKNSTF